MKILNNILEAIGNTPIVKLNKIGSNLDCNLFVKCEGCIIILVPGIHFIGARAPICLAMLVFFNIDDCGDDDADDGGHDNAPSGRR